MSKVSIFNPRIECVGDQKICGLNLLPLLHLEIKKGARRVHFV